MAPAEMKTTAKTDSTALLMEGNAQLRNRRVPNASGTAHARATNASGPSSVPSKMGVVILAGAWPVSAGKLQYARGGMAVGLI